MTLWKHFRASQLCSSANDHLSTMIVRHNPTASSWWSLAVAFDYLFIRLHLISFCICLPPLHCCLVRRRIAHHPLSKVRRSPSIHPSIHPVKKTERTNESILGQSPRKTLSRFCCCWWCSCSSWMNKLFPWTHTDWLPCKKSRNWERYMSGFAVS